MEGDRGGDEQEEDDDDDISRATVFGIQIHLLDTEPFPGDPDEVKGNRPEWVTRRAVVLFLKEELSETHCFTTINDADNLINYLMAILNLLSNNVKEVTSLRPKPVHTKDKKGHEKILITATAKMNKYVSRVLRYTVGPFLGEIAGTPPVAGIQQLLQIFLRHDFGMNTTNDSAEFGPQVLTFVTDLLRPIVMFLHDQLQRGNDAFSIEQASTAITDMAGLVRLAQQLPGNPSNPKNTEMILNGHRQMAASLMPGFERRGLNVVNLLRVFYFGLAGAINHERGSPFLPELGHTIRSELVHFFRSEWMASANVVVGNEYVVNDEMALRFLLAFLFIASTKTVPLSEIKTLEMFHQNIKSSRPVLPCFSGIGKEGPDVRLSGHSKLRRSDKEREEVCPVAGYCMWSLSRLPYSSSTTDFFRMMGSLKKGDDTEMRKLETTIMDETRLFGLMGSRFLFAIRRPSLWTSHCLQLRHLPILYSVVCTLRRTLFCNLVKSAQSARPDSNFFGGR